MLDDNSFHELETPMLCDDHVRTSIAPLQRTDIPYLPFFGLPSTSLLTPLAVPLSVPAPRFLARSV